MKAIKLAVVKSLAKACGLVDEVAYRPLIVNLFEFWPWPWTCQFSKLSVWLDDRWNTGYWDSGAPHGRCEICNRRAAWLTIGGYEDEEDAIDDPYFLGDNPIDVCSWCSLIDYQTSSEEEFRVAVSAARDKSISWRWKWPVDTGQSVLDLDASPDEETL